MRTLLSILLLAGFTAAQSDPFNWLYDEPSTMIIYNLDLYDQSTMPFFLDDYSAPGQLEWNIQVNWLIKQNKRLLYYEKIRQNSQTRE